ncbi:MAG: hypothetical protein ACLVBA_16180 [Alistipes finegoldii]
MDLMKFLAKRNSPVPFGTWPGLKLRRRSVIRLPGAAEDPQTGFRAW